MVSGSGGHSGSGRHGGLDGADEALARARREVRELAERWSGGPAGEDGMRGEGTAAGGLVRVVAAGGRIARVELDPKVMRMPSASLAEEFAKAANAAIDDLRSAYAAAMPEVDLDALASDMEQVEELGLHALRRAAQSIDRAAEQYRRLGQR